MTPDEFDQQINQVLNGISRTRRFARRNKTKILAGTTVVATIAALRYRAKLNDFNGKLLLEVTPKQLEQLKQGGAGIYDVLGTDVIVRRVRPVDLGLSA